MHVSLYLSMQICFEVVLEIHCGPVDQRVVVFLLKFIEVGNVVGFRTVEIKITCSVLIERKACIPIYLCACLYR